MANVSLLGLKLGAKIKIEGKWTKSGLLSWQEAAEAPVAGRVSGQWSVVSGPQAWRILATSEQRPYICMIH